jgi:hypothetical protein
MSNKYQEVLKRLRTNEYLTSREQREYYDILQELVDKETPRTEQEILKDFEKLGYQIPFNNESELDIGQQIVDGWYGMRIYKYAKVYKTYTIIKGECHCAETYMQEHKLLNELFTIWRWLE